MTKILIQALLFGTIMMGCTSISNENNPNNNNENNSNNYKENNSNNNKFEVIISAELYENAPSDSIDINSLSINNDQLTINFSSSGCSGDSWDLILLDSGEITDSVPPKRFLRLSLNNSEFSKILIVASTASMLEPFFSKIL